jgi:hypothetical protein
VRSVDEIAGVAAVSCIPASGPVVVTCTVELGAVNTLAEFCVSMNSTVVESPAAALRNPDPVMVTVEPPAADPVACPEEFNVGVVTEVTVGTTGS